MPAGWGELVDLLDAEAAVCRELVQAMKRERQAMIRSRLNGVGSVAAEKQALIERLHAVEERRSKLIGQMAGQSGCAPAELTLSRLARTAPSPHGKALSRCRSELSDLLKQLREENRHSEVLCRHTGELLRASYGVVKSLAATGSVYQREGRMQGVQLHGKLVCDEI